MADGDPFLSRWSRRKAVARTAAMQADEKPAATVDARPAAPAAEPFAPAVVEPVAAPKAEPAAEQPAPLTLADVALLSRDSDYSAFVARDVAPEVRNAALKQLFTDPHYNVMDGLDIYIDDYGKPDPLPPGMLRQMTQTAFLGLFDDDETEAARLAQSGSPSEADPTEAPIADAADTPRPAPDEDPDLRLQPDHAAQRSGVGADPEEDPGRER